MTISKKIINKILTINRFSLMVAYILDIGQESAKKLAKRGSDKLAHAKLIEFYKEQGFTDEEIWE